MALTDHALNHCGLFLSHTMRRIIEKSVTYLQLFLLGMPLLLRENHPRPQEIPLGTLLAFHPVAFSFLLPPAEGKRKARMKERKTIEGLCETLMHNGLLLSTVKLNTPQTNANSATKQSSIPHLPCFFLCLPGSFTDQREENEQRTKMVNGKS